MVGCQVVWDTVNSVDVHVYLCMCEVCMCVCMCEVCVCACV